MLIGLCGGICAGKRSVIEYLAKEHGFEELRVAGKPKYVLHDREIETISEDLPSENSHIFPTVDDMVSFVTERWQERWVTSDIRDEAALETLLLRPFFLLVSIDAPVSLRWQRFAARRQRLQFDSPDLEKFVRWNDRNLYDRTTGIVYLTEQAQVRLFNPTSSLQELYASLDALNLPDEQRLRPGWDQYFMQLASLAAQRSNCMKRRVGCVLVREKRVISTGYNGTPRHTKNCNEGGCPRCNDGQRPGASLSTCLCIHAEENALLEAGKERVGDGATLYCNTCPCLTCSVKIAQLGISEVVYSRSYHMDQDSAAILKEAGVHLRQFSPPRNGLIYLQESEIRLD